MKILLVDDREDNLYMLGALLKGNGFSVLSARDGREALDLARDVRPDLAISDILMPGMDGFALCAEWKNDRDLRVIPFIFYTATYTDPRDEALALSMGADRFILKPAEPEDLMREIHEVISGIGSKEAERARDPSGTETVILKEYNEALVRKLEDKLEQIESLVAELNGKEKRLEHINRVLRGVRAVNQLIVKEKRKDVLIDEACARLVRDSGYNGAWIVLKGEQGKVMGSQVGFGEDFAFLADLFEKGGLPPCCQRASREQDVIIMPEGHPHHDGCPISETCGRTISLVAPLEHEGRNFGYLVVSLPPHISSDEEEISLFREMAGDVAYALHNIEVEEERRRTGEILKTTFESASDGIMIADAETRIIVRSNPAMFSMLGFRPGEINGLKIEDMHPEEGLGPVLAALERQITGESPIASDIPFKRKDGTILFADVNSGPIEIDGRKHLIGVIRDVTYRRDSEEKERKSARRLRRALLTTIQVLGSTLEIRDPYTSGHQRRVAALAGAIAEEMGMGEDAVEGIIMVGQVHDIGKISVPAEILSKPGTLSPLEFQIIREHPAHGREILRGVDSPLPIGEIVYQHHERVDGSGYPQGLKGEDILIEARILAVADVVEAMASHRPYRPSLGVDEAMAEIEKNSGIKYDGEVSRVCLQLFREKGYSLAD